jgi:putative peptidoglycan lipid II flippase
MGAEAVAKGSAETPGGAGTVDVASQSLARPAALMAVGTALSRLTGLGRVVAMAFALGVAESRLADAYNLANTLPLVLYELVLGGVLTSVFIPVLVEELRTKSPREAWQSVSTLVCVSLAVLVVLSAITVAIAPWIIDLLTLRASGSQAPEQRELATLFLRLLAPTVALFGFTAIAGGLLNAHGRFGVPQFAPVVNNVVVIATFLAFAWLTAGTPTTESVDASTGQTLLLGLGTTGGVAVMAGVYWPFLHRLPGRLNVRLDLRHPALKKLARLSLWTLGYVVTNVAGFAVSFYLAGDVQGGVTAYVTAFAFFQMPIGIAAVSIVTALVPKLSAHYVDGDVAAFRERFAGGLRMTALLLVPASAAYLVLADPLIKLLLEHGVVREGSVELVASVLRLFAVGLLPFSVYQLLMRAYYARQDSRTPALVNVVENAVTIGLGFALFALIEVKGLALAHSLGYVAGCLVAWRLLARRVDGLRGLGLATELAKVTLAGAAAAAAMLAVREGAAGLVDAGELRALLQLGAGGAAGAVVFVALARFLRVRDLASFRRLLPGA